jgi:2-amino-4-hydroxy-6-hydroxymethyldihydropteridine diphosphokinase
MEIGLSLGSNLGDRVGYLRQAAGRIAALPQVRILAAAPVYETAPVGVQPAYADLKYLNTVLILDGPEDLDALSEALHAIETDLGRRRSADRNAPRTIDIDILYAGDVRRRDGKLDLPHPRWAERRFVLQPLADIRPRLVLPDGEGTMAEHLARLPDDEGIVCWAKVWLDPLGGRPQPGVARVSNPSPRQPGERMNRRGYG